MECIVVEIKETGDATLATQKKNMHITRLFVGNKTPL